jgi:hypothetical protein
MNEGNGIPEDPTRQYTEGPSHSPQNARGADCGSRDVCASTNVPLASRNLRSWIGLTWLPVHYAIRRPAERILETRVNELHNLECGRGHLSSRDSAMVSRR